MKFSRILILVGMLCLFACEDDSADVKLSDEPESKYEGPTLKGDE